MDAQDTTTLNAFTLDQLPSELLAMLIHKIGIKVAKRCLPPKTKLRRAWRESVRMVILHTRLMSYQSIKSLHKYVNLKALRFLGGSPGSIPLWRAIAFLAPSLTRLRGIFITESTEAFAVLRTLAGLESVASRLERLRLDDKTHSLSTDDLWALVDLKALTYLNLSCRTVEGSELAQLDTVCQLLTSLHKLDLSTAPGGDDEPAVASDTLAAFPGSLTSLTSLVLNRQQQAFEDIDDAMAQEEREEQVLASAVSGLTNLQHLSTNYYLRSIAAQEQALQQLKQLTRLHLSHKQAGLPLLILPAELEALVCLKAPSHSVADPFEHPSLEELEAGRIEVSEQWRGRTAEECGITKLSLTDWEDNADVAPDEELQHMPLLPELTSFSCKLRPRDGRYAHLAALLRRQASSLQQCKLFLSDPLQEALPRELPACTSLTLSGQTAVSQHTLQLLAMCSMPSLVELQLQGLWPDSAVAGLDLAWLRGLPALKKLTLISDANGWISGDVPAEVVALMEGSGVELVLMEQIWQ